MVKSSSVGAPEPEKLQKNKVGPIIWDTLYIKLSTKLREIPQRPALSQSRIDFAI